MSYLRTAAALFLLRVTYVLALQCPPADQVSPCVCVPEVRQSPWINCDKIDDTSVLKTVFEKSGDRKFTGLLLKDSIMSYFPAEALVSKKIEHLYFFDCTMISLFDVVPTAENIVWNMVLTNVKIERGINWEFFKNLKTLQLFYAGRTEIKSLGKKFVENFQPKNIKYFTFNETKLNKIYPNAFQKFENMMHLEIMNSFVRDIKRSMFPTPSPLLSINFSGNLIESLPADIFSQMPNLKNIYLDKNKLSVVSEAVFKQAQISVEYLNLENNPIRCDCTLKWILNRQRRNHVIGQCQSPSDKKEKQLEDLTAAHFDYCN